MTEMSTYSKEEKIKYLHDIIESDDYSLDYMKTFIQYMDDEDPEVRALAISGLWDYPEPELIDSLLAKARNDPSLQVRSTAIAILGRYIYEGEMADYDFDWGAMDALMREDELPEEDFLRVKDFLLDIFHNEAEALEIRATALEALGFLVEPEILELVAAAYARPEMKKSAIIAMGRGGHEGWRDVLLEELHNPKREIRLEAIRAVGEAGFEEAVPRLKELARSRDKEIRLEAIWALGKVGGEEEREFLEARARAKDKEVREIAQAALFELDSRCMPLELWDDDL